MSQTVMCCILDVSGPLYVRVCAAASMPAFSLHDPFTPRYHIR